MNVVVNLCMCMCVWTCVWVQRNAKGNKQRLNRCHTDINLTNQCDWFSIFYTSLSTSGKLLFDLCVCVHPPPLPRFRAMALPSATQAFRAPYSHRPCSLNACSLHLKGTYHHAHWYLLYPNPVTTPCTFRDWSALHRANIIDFSTSAGTMERSTSGQEGDQRSRHLSHTLGSKKSLRNPFNVRDSVGVHDTQHSPRLKNWPSGSN